jgi:hypothetical protein
MAWRPHPKRAETDPQAPRAWATCDRSGMQTNHFKLQQQRQWAGTQIIDEKFLVDGDFNDEPQRQLGTLILPPDPPPIMNARPENYTADETPVTTRIVTQGSPGSLRVLAGNVKPLRIVE